MINQMISLNLINVEGVADFAPSPSKENVHCSKKVLWVNGLEDEQIFDNSKMPMFEGWFRFRTMVPGALPAVPVCVLISHELIL